MFVKRISERLDYTLDFSGAMDDADGIASIDATTVEPSGELFVSSVLSGPKTVIVWADGGVAGNRYEIDVKVTTSAGRRLVGHFYIYVIDD